MPEPIEPGTGGPSAPRYRIDFTIMQRDGDRAGFTRIGSGRSTARRNVGAALLDVGAIVRERLWEVEGSPAERARDIADRARALADEIAALQRDAWAYGSEPAPHWLFRCDEAAAEIRHAAGELDDTAADLDRVAAASAPGTCTVPWGVCPAHGNTLISSGGQCWCQRTGCGRRWDYDRAFLPCTEPARFNVTDQAGDGGEMCTRHAADARERLEGAVITPLAGEDPR